MLNDRFAKLQLLTRRQLAKKWGVSQSFVRRIPYDKLPVVMLGPSTPRYHPDHIARYERENTLAR